MANITLKRENVIKQVESEEQALLLELKGFKRLDAAGKILLKEADTSGQAYPEQEALKQELADVREKLKEASEYAEQADKRIATLEQELAGTKEQLEAALKQNRKQAKEKKEEAG